MFKAVTAAGFHGHTEVIIVKRDEAVGARKLQLWFATFAIFPKRWRSVMAYRAFDYCRRTFLCAGAAGLLAASAPGLAIAQTAAKKPRIGVIGAGNIGSTIGGLWVKAGYEVFFSSRHPEELKPLTDKLGPRAKSGTVGEALDFGDVILIAVPYKAIPELAKDYGPKFAGKTVVDPANAVARRDGEELLNETKQKGIGNTTESYLKGSH